MLADLGRLHLLALDAIYDIPQSPRELSVTLSIPIDVAETLIRDLEAHDLLTVKTNARAPMHPAIQSLGQDQE